MITIHARVALARRRLIDAGIPDSEALLDARLLARQVLGWDAARFAAASGEPESADFEQRYDALIGRRTRREPVAYIIGHREFWGLNFEVSPAVLIPRPETEGIIEAALDLVPDRGASFLAADICTGSGCLAVAIAREYPAARCVATDVSSEALAVARRNAARNAAADRVDFVLTDLLQGTQTNFHLIVSNPPYVPERDRESLAPEVRDHEPAVALFAGSDGMDLITRLVSEAPAHLASGSFLLFEFGSGQAEAVEELIGQSNGLTMVDLRRDLQGIPRVAIARRS